MPLNAHGHIEQRWMNGAVSALLRVNHKGLCSGFEIQYSLPRAPLTLSPSAHSHLPRYQDNDFTKDIVTKHVKSDECKCEVRHVPETRQRVHNQKYGKGSEITVNKTGTTGSGRSGQTNDNRAKNLYIFNSAIRLQK
jgi:hypothetical protein